jgi:hypothetical protein
VDSFSARDGDILCVDFLDKNNRIVVSVQKMVVMAG